MRIYHPGQVEYMRNGYVSLSDRSFGSYKYRLALPVAYDLEHRDPFFWCTKGRTENDCVHSKLVAAPFVPDGESPVLSDEITVGNYKYTSRFLHFSDSPKRSVYLTQKGKDGPMAVVYIYHQIRTQKGIDGYYYLNGGIYFLHCTFTGSNGSMRYYTGCSVVLNCANGKVYGNRLTHVSPFDGRTYIADDDWARFRAGSDKELLELLLNHALDTYGAYYRWALALESTSSSYETSATIVDVSEARREDVGQVGSSTGFLFDEPNRVVSKLGFTTNPLSGYWYNWLVEHAYYDALDSAPVLNDNNLQNLGEVAKFISDLVVHKRITIPRSLNDAWLAYRYSVSTTKSDIEEAIEFVRRNSDLSALQDASRIHCYGIASTSYEGVEVTCRCKLTLHSKELELFDQLWTTLYKYGLAPDLYVLWDSLPYSFIVDWFIPLGDVFAVVDASNVYGGEAFDIEDVVFSLSYDRVMEGNLYHFYSRWLSRPLKRLNGLYWLDKPAAKESTWLTRVLDAAALIVRR